MHHGLTVVLLDGGHVLGSQFMVNAACEVAEVLPLDAEVFPNIVSGNLPGQEVEVVVLGDVGAGESRQIPNVGLRG